MKIIRNKGPKWIGLRYSCPCGCVFELTSIEDAIEDQSNNDLIHFACPYCCSWITHAKRAGEYDATKWCMLSLSYER